MNYRCMMWMNLNKTGKPEENNSCIFLKTYPHRSLVQLKKPDIEMNSHLEARVSPGNVTTGVPVHKMSMLVVCPLQSGVSRHTSANCPRRTCSSLAATLEKIMRPGGKPVNQQF